MTTDKIEGTGCILLLPLFLIALSLREDPRLWLVGLTNTSGKSSYWLEEEKILKKKGSEKERPRLQFLNCVNL